MPHEVSQIGEGWRGTAQTVHRIRQLVEDSLTDPVVVQATRNVVRNVPERDRDAEIQAISNFVRSKIRYTREAVETLSTPRLLLDEIRKHGKATGDCDEFVTLWLAMHRILSHPVRVRTVSQRKDGLANHIYGEVWSPTRGWIADDTIVKRKPLGWSIPKKKITKSRVFQMSGLNGDETMVSRFDPVGVREPRRFHPEVVTEYEEGGPGQMGNWIQVGRTSVKSAQAVASKRRAMRSHSLAPKSFRLKSPGMLWVGNQNNLEECPSGLGVEVTKAPAPATNVWDAVAAGASALIPAVTEAYQTYVAEHRPRPSITIPSIPGLTVPSIGPGVPVPMVRPPAPKKEGMDVGTIVLIGGLVIVGIMALRGR